MEEDKKPLTLTDLTPEELYLIFEYRNNPLKRKLMDDLLEEHARKQKQKSRKKIKPT